MKVMDNSKQNLELVLPHIALQEEKIEKLSQLTNLQERNQYLKIFFFILDLSSFFFLI